MLLNLSSLTRRLLPALACLALLPAALAQDSAAVQATIRKNLSARVPQLGTIDEVRKSPIDGLYEIRIGNDVLYSDAEGDHVVQGAIIDTRTRTDLTEERVNALTAFDFAKLPLKDAMVIRQGSGARKLVVFADPHCGYCKQLERDLVKLKDVTIYTFLYPILGPGSDEKSRAIWCSKDAMATWRDWMIDGKAPPRVMGAGCDSAAIERNVALGRKHRVTATPALVFADGRRSAGALPLAELEKRVAAGDASARKKS